MADAKPTDPTDDSILATARKRFTAAVEANGPWAVQALIDLKWSAGTSGDRSYQWPEVVQQARDLAQRPFETINLIPSFIKQITNQQRQAGLSMQVVPLKRAKSKRDAEAREGLLRHTMLISEGEVQVDTMFEDMATHGKGWAEVVNRYESEDDGTDDDQELYVEWRDPFTVLPDPAAVKLDKADMKYAFIPFRLPTEDYNTLYPDSQIAKLGSQAWQGMAAQDVQTWFPEGSVQVATYYTVEEEAKPVQRPGMTRQLKRKYVVKRTINALEVLEEVRMMRGSVALKRIPLVPMLGDRYVIDGKEDYRGMVRMARGPQQMLNFWITSLTEAIAYALKAPLMVGWSQLEGMEAFWARLNDPTLQYLPYKDTGANGQPGNSTPPFRPGGEPANIQAITAAINIAHDSLQRIMQLYDPSLGKGKADQSGSAINALQQQGEIGNSNYIDNEKRFFRSLGRLLLQMYPVYYDTARIRRIIGSDGKPQTIAVHAGQDNAPDPTEMAELADEEMSAESIFDLAEGHFDVNVNTGPTFLSRRQDANANMLQMWKIAPSLLPMMLPDFLDNSDWPGSHEMAEIARQTISAPFQKQNPGDPQQTIAQLKKILDQAMQQHQLLVQENQAKTQYIQTDQAKHDANVQIKKAEFAMQEALQKLKNAATIAVAEINAQTKGVVSANELEHEKIALLMDNAHSAASDDLQRGHELAMAQVDHAATTQQTDQQHQNSLEQAAQPPPVDPNAPQPSDTGASGATAAP